MIGLTSSAWEEILTIANRCQLLIDNNGNHIKIRDNEDLLWVYKHRPTLAPLAGIMSEKTVNRIGIPEDIDIPNWGADANEFTVFVDAMMKLPESSFENWAIDDDDTRISDLTSLHGKYQNKT